MTLTAAKVPLMFLSSEAGRRILLWMVILLAMVMGVALAGCSSPQSHVTTCMSSVRRSMVSAQGDIPGATSMGKRHAERASNAAWQE